MNGNRNSQYGNGNRRRINRRNRDAALKGAILGLLAFTLIAVAVFGFMLASRVSWEGNTPVTTDGDTPPSTVVTDPPQTSGGDTTDVTPGTDPVTAPPSTEPPVTQPPATEPPVTEPPAPQVPGEKRVSFLACGDNIVHDAVREDAKKRANAANPGFNFYDMYAGVAEEIGSADISFVNMEGCVGGAALGYLGYPNFNAPNEIGEAFVKLGFDVVNLLNNHTLDYGEVGYANTIKFFDTLPVTVIGGYTKENYDNIRVIDKNGIRIAFLSYTNIMNYDPSTWLPRQLPSDSPYLISNATDA
ncbi:MAG: CapA family protein, partial [Clostridia bacterium]|nr:CapA family protein [Clostridia bacterium]